MSHPTSARAAAPRRLLCNCQKTMQVDGQRLSELLADGPDDGGSTVHSELCRAQLKSFEAALAEGRPLLVACTQEAPLFREVAEEHGAGVPIAFTNIRERAGWTTDSASPMPKMAALLAEAAYDAKPAGAATLTSHGVCLVYGRGQAALDVAAELAGRLSVSVLLTDAEGALPPSSGAMPIARGRIRTARGVLGNFEIEVDGYAAMLPSSRKACEFAMARNGARSSCDLILDMSGERALFSDAQRRDGYLRADPGKDGDIARAILKAADLVGEFEKPLYVSLDPAICAHARSQKVGCRNCLDNCPTGAITPAGDHVAVDAAICGGCGNCNAVCPTGAISYAYPTRADLVQRMEVLLATYTKAGGKRPILLLHDEKTGAPMIATSARLGRGLPAHVLPLSLYSALQMGHETMLAALAMGAERVIVLASPEHREELAALEQQTTLADALLTGLGIAGPRVIASTERDPEALETLLYDLTPLPVLPFERLNALGGKRELARGSLARLKALGAESGLATADVFALPAGSPYGRIKVDTGGCTLCLACVGACPANALHDDPERPQLSFTEAACVQCGICAATCPEKVIGLEPRYDTTNAALSPVVLKSEEPFHCVSCGKAFGTRATIERVLERLQGRHAMFKNSEQAQLIQMCDTCRVTTLANSGNDPFRLGERPRVRTTDDYLAEREGPAHPTQDAARKPDDFLN